MDQFPQNAGDEHIRMTDLEWLDLSDLIRIDDEWRRALAIISQLHLAVSAMLALVVIGYNWVGRGGPPSPVETGAMVGIGLCIAGMAFFVWASQTGTSRILSNLRFVVFLSRRAVSLMAYLLRDLQGDYHLTALRACHTQAVQLTVTVQERAGRPFTLGGRLIEEVNAA